MRVSISENKKRNLISIGFYSINYEIVFKIIELLNIDIISIFGDEFERYKYYRTINKCDYFEIVPKIRESLLMFDGEKKQCKINQEMELLCSSRILISIDLDENYTHIMINTLLSNDISSDMIKEGLNKFKQ